MVGFNSGTRGCRHRDRAVLQSEGERDDMRGFWMSHSQHANLEEMMLDTEADVISPQEVAEVLSLLPDVSGLDVLELGAGIGRYTTELARSAKSVVAVDFMDKFVKRNQELNGHHDNVTFIQADVTELERDRGSFDLIFTNWLFMYLDDVEVRAVLKKTLTWLRPGGKLFFRESCFHQSGNAPRSLNPTHYREPASYNALLQSTTVTGDDDGHDVYELVFSKSVQTYIKLKNNPHQICWLLEKTHVSGEPRFKTLQEFLDGEQYSRNGILRYETIFGRHFVSTGGLETTQEFVKLLELEPGQRVLDVGAGIGGGAFYMAQNYDVTVLGIDLSYNMVSIAMERAHEINDTRVQFEVSDATKREFADNSFDVVYSRDTILHIKDKAALFSRFLRWLRPGGRLLVSDYCCGGEDDQRSDDFRRYVSQRGYHLLTLPQYGQVIKGAGFTDVRVEDKTNLFVSVLKRELDKLETKKDEFVTDFGEAGLAAIMDGWTDKIRRCGRGEQKWALLLARKPSL